MSIIALLISIFTNSAENLITEKALTNIYNKINPKTIDNAYKRALKKWSNNSYVRKSYADNKIGNFAKFVVYIQNDRDINDKYLNSLFSLFEIELKEDTTTYIYILELQEEIVRKDVKNITNKVNDILSVVQNNSLKLEEITQRVSAWNGEREFEPINDYLQRNCRLKNSDNNWFEQFTHPNRPILKYSLIDYVIGNADSNNKKIILYADAQSGKTTELKKLAYDLQLSNLCIPILYQIKDNSQPFLPQNMLPEDEKTYVIIIDALDERFNGEERRLLFQEINKFAKTHKNLRMVLSCRKNFDREINIEGFEELVLEDLSWKQTCEYIKSMKATRLIKEIKNNELDEIIRIPFFLKILVESYLKNNKLLKNKSKLYEYFIDKKLLQEDDKNLKYMSRFQDKGKLALQKLAIALQIMNISELSEIEILNLISNDQEQYQRILRSGLVCSNNNKISFLFNSFKEFFVSEYLATIKTLTNIQKICCYPRSKKIITTWYNIIALFLSQLSRSSSMFDDVLNWIKEDNYEMILFIDKELIDKDSRAEIFINILNDKKHKQQSLFYFGDRNYELFMIFGYSEKTISYIIAELSSSKNFNYHIANLLWLSRYILWRNSLLNNQLYLSLKENILIVFKKYFDSNEHIFYLFLPYENTEFLTVECVDELYYVVKNSVKPKVVNHFIKYIVNSKAVDKYIDYIIQNQKFLHTYYSDNGAINIMDKTYLYNAYMDVQNIVNIKKVFKQIITSYDEFNHDVLYEKDYFNNILSSLLESLENFYLDDNTVGDYVYERLLDNLSKLLHTSESVDNTVKLYNDFFIKINKDEYYFKKSYNIIKSYIFDKVEHTRVELNKYAFSTSIFLNEYRIENICSSIKKQDLDSYLLLEALKVYAKTDMQDNIKTIESNRYSKFYISNTLPVYQLKRQKNLNDLFNYEEFKNQVHELIEKNSLRTKDRLADMRRTKIDSSIDNDQINDYIFGLFYENIDKDGNYNLESILETVDIKDKYEFFLIKQIGPLLYNGTDVSIDESSKKYLYKIAQKFLLKVADGVIKLDSHSNYSAIDIMLHKDIVVDKNALLKMLSYSYYSILCGDGTEFSVFDLIKDNNEISIREIETKLYEILKDNNNIIHEKSKVKWVSFFISNEIEYGYFYSIKWSIELDYGNSAVNILDSLLDSEQTRDLVLDNITSNKYTQVKIFYIVDNIISKKYKILNFNLLKYLEDNFESTSNMEYKLQILSRLLRLGSMKALEYFVSNFNKIELPSYCSVNYTAIGSIDLLIKLLEINFDKMKQDKYFEPTILNSLKNIAFLNYNNMQRVNQKVKSLIEKNQNKYSYLYSYLDIWTEEFMDNNVHKYTIDDVKKIIKGENTF